MAGWTGFSWGGGENSRNLTMCRQTLGFPDLSRQTMYPEDFGPSQNEAIRNILLKAWKDMSLGDLSLVLSCKNAGDGFLTTHQAPLDRFLLELETLGWVQRSYKLPMLNDVSLSLRAYELTEDGACLLPAFIDHYGLMNVGEALRKMRSQKLDAARAANAAREEWKLRKANRGPLFRFFAYVEEHSTMGRLADPAPREPSTWRDTLLRFTGAFSITFIFMLIVNFLSGAFT